MSEADETFRKNKSRRIYKNRKRVYRKSKLKEYLSVKGYSLNQIEILSLITKEQFKIVEYEV